MINMVDSTTNLKALRAELGVTQEDFSYKASIRIKTYRSAEWGKPVTNKTAQAILAGINNLRSEKGLQAVRMEDLGINLY